MMCYVPEQQAALCSSLEPEAELSEQFSWRPSQDLLLGDFSELLGCPDPEH